MSAQLDLSAWNALKFRCIGPPRGGRVVAVAGHPSERATFYFGACAGGVWKTTDGGTYWESIKELVSVDSKTAFDRLRKPIRLNAKLINLISVIGAADAAPTRQTYDVFAHLSVQVDAQLDKLDSILEESVADFNAAVKAADVPAVVV